MRDSDLWLSAQSVMDAGENKSAVCGDREAGKGGVRERGVVVGVVGLRREVAGADGDAHEAEAYAAVDVEEAREKL